jgi:signal transduction histidine kinase
MYIELTKMTVQDSSLKETIAKEEIVANNIQRQIEFTKAYEDIGVNTPLWQNVAALMSHILPSLEQTGVQLSVSTGNLEVYADPLLLKVFENLVDNSLRHGEHVQHITITCEKQDTGLSLMYMDDGAGVPVPDKEKIFEKGFGKNTGLGLFLTREILSITGISITESGDYGKGVIFMIHVPEGCYRFNGKTILPKS